MVNSPKDLREASPNELDDILATILTQETNASAPPEQMDQTARMLRDHPRDVLIGAAARCLASTDVEARACTRLLDVAVRNGPFDALVDLSALFLAKFPLDEGLIERKLRLLLTLGRRDELLDASAKALELEEQSVHLSFAIVSVLHRTLSAEARWHDDLFRRALALFSSICEGLPEKDFWWGRYYRETQASYAGIRRYLKYVNEGELTARYRSTALREGGDLAIVGDRWGRDAQLLLRAWEEDTSFRRPWRSDAARVAFSARNISNSKIYFGDLDKSNIFSKCYEEIGSPEVAFNYMIDKILPMRIPYAPENRLMMIGSSLSSGGMERIFANTYRGLSSMGVFDGIRMALSVFKPGETSSFYLDETGVNADEISLLHTTDTPAFPFSMLPDGLARRAWAAYQMILVDRPRVIHAWNDATGLIGAFAGLLAGCPRILIHFHHTRAIGFSRDRWLARSYPHCFRRLIERPEIDFLFVAEATATDYADWWCVDRTSKFKTLYNGLLDLAAPPEKGAELRESLGIPKGSSVVGGVFRFDPVKKASLWIDAAQLIHKAMPDTCFVLVGAGPELEAAKAQVSAYGLDTVFHFAGRVKNVADYFASFDLLLLASSVEGLPNCLVEAQLARVPVVSTNAGGSRETFVPGVTGQIVESERAEDLAAVVVACLTNEDWRQKAASKSREAALERFSINRYLQALVAHYHPEN